VRRACPIAILERHWIVLGVNSGITGNTAGE
jgi:hypothetical protein